MKRPHVEVNLGELDQMLDRACEAPLSQTDSAKIKNALHTLAEVLAARRTTEKTREVLGDAAAQPAELPGQPAPAKDERAKTPGHGRHAASSYEGARKVVVTHPELQHGDRCPECGSGNVYEQKESKPLVRIVGQAPLSANIYELQRLRCNGCGQVFTAPEPSGVGTEKFDETAGAMIAQLKYGSGMPFARIEELEQRLGIPLPASTQWEIVEEVAELAKPARDELIRQAASGGLFHNDDTGMRVLKMERPPGDKRTGVFTSGIVSVGERRRVALFFTGREHAGENLGAVLAERAADLPAPVQMCDALSRNTPKLDGGVELLVANCLTHGRRQFVELVGAFPGQCRFVLETLGRVYANDAEARAGGLLAGERLRLHQERSGPLMESLREWFDEQIRERKAEPNSGLGKAIQYFQRHWKALTLFLRQPGAPLDNNVCERALKRAVLHRKNALFYRTLHGAEVGDLFMSLIHTCELNTVNSFDYLVALQRNADALARSPQDWMPWNFAQNL
ncbi:MAG TPA: IS66 family transposase [Burkholderiales bacterium]|nr:IS66 family transposase [Burkholderiales bacterium]